MTQIAESTTFVDVLRQRADRHPDRQAFIMLENGEHEKNTITYRALDRKARGIAAALRDAGGVGRPVILAHPPGLDYVAAIFGCLYAGAIAVPAYPPRSSRYEARLATIILDTGAELALTTSSLLLPSQQSMDKRLKLGQIRWLATDILSDDLAEEWHNPVINAQTLALLQYTSGSTSAPKGVMINHANLLHNQLALRAGFNQTEQSVIANWLPPYHDMGLMGNVLHPVFVGALCVMMTPLSFTQRPERWLRVITRYRATTSGGPNFAYELCVRRIDPDNCHELDLSSWSVAFNGAERVQCGTIRRFIEAYTRFGFRRNAFRVCYGLAEATLVVSVRGDDAGQSDAPNGEEPAGKIKNDGRAMISGSKDVVSCGRGVAGQKITIVDPDSLVECGDGEVGEVWVFGPSRAQGYWNRPDETEQTFNAFLSDTKSGPFLRTGDLGFMNGGELFILGRIKELIIIRGENHYPEDIETTVRACNPLLEKGRGAAFSVDLKGGERLVVVHEVKAHDLSDPAGLAGEIRQAVSQEHGLQIYAIILVKPGGIPKTSSGKIQRRICRESFLNGSLDFLYDSILADDPPRGKEAGWDRERILLMDPGGRKGALEKYLIALIARSAGISPEQLIGLEGINQAGIDSLQSAELAAQVESDLGVILPPVFFLQAQSVTELSLQIAKAIETESAPLEDSGAEISASQTGAEIQTGYTLSSFQERIWQISLLTPDNPALCLNQALHFSGRLNRWALEKSLDAIVERHETLRTRIGFDAGRPVQMITAAQTASLPMVDLRALNTKTQEEVTSQISNALFRSRFDLSRSPLLKVTLILLDDDHSILYVSLSHFIADGWSCELFIEDLSVFYRVFSGSAGELPAELPIQYKDFSQRQRKWLQSEEMSRQQEFWKRQLAGSPSELEIPTDHPRYNRRATRRKRQTVNLSRELLIALHELSRREGVTLFVALLAALKALLHRYSGESDIVVSAPVAHRNRREYRRLIGCFANRLLLRTILQRRWSISELIRSVREVTLNALANQDLPLGEVEKLINHQDEVKTANRLLSQILFQYYKTAEKWDLPGVRLSCQGPEIEAAHFELFVIAQEIDQDLRLSFLYNSELFEDETIEQLIDSYLGFLRQFVADTKVELLSLTLQPGLKERFDKRRESRKVIAIAATFTARPLKESLDFWMRQLELPITVEFAQYGNVFQSLLDPDSVFNKNPNGFNLVLVRLWDWRGAVKGSSGSGDALDGARLHIERTAKDLVTALKIAVARSASPYILGFCPACGDSRLATVSERMEQWVEAELSGITGLHLITTSDWLTAYPVRNPCQPYGDKLGHIPYTEEFFAAFGTILARKIYALSTEPPKVIVLDCDMTLWNGICGEDGPMAVELDPPSLFLQQFMKSRAEQGMLLCLCSKNNEEDVLQVFEARSDMILRIDDLVAWRINWEAKSENLRSMADELQLGLDSFVFIDDDPMECAEVRMNCPEALVFQLPRDRFSIPKYLNHIWVLDRRNLTDEDGTRTILYQQEKQRQMARAAASNLKEFISDLNLQVSISEINLDQIPRVAQLVQRTNQFNLTGLKRSEPEIRQLWQSRKYQCLGVTVEDRFGCYGLVGVIIFRLGPASINIDTLLLSCRVLGRGVEHQALAKIGEIAMTHGLEYVEVPFIDTKKNRPASEFIYSIGAGFHHNSAMGAIFRIPARVIRSLQYQPDALCNTSDHIH